MYNFGCLIVLQETLMYEGTKVLCSFLSIHISVQCSHALLTYWNNTFPELTHRIIPCLNISIDEGNSCDLSRND